MKPAVWPALLVAPSVALTDVLASHTLTGQLCEHATQRILYFAQLPSLVLVILCTLLAAVRLRAIDATQACAERSRIDAPATRPWFLAAVALWIGLLSILVIIAVGIPVWLLPPCW